MILMLGVAGSGKSTLSNLLAENGNYRQIFMSELLRRNMSGQDSVDMLAGKLMKDGTVISYLDQELANLGKGPEIILDGFPRSVYQAEWLAGKHNAGIYDLSAVVLIEIPKAVVIERLVKRGRLDDTPASINSRFADYEITINTIINDLSSHGVPIIKVNGNKDSLEVHADIVKALNGL